MTTTYLWFLAAWSKRLPWQEVAEVFHTSWNSVYRAVMLAVLWGLANRSLEGIGAIGVDEIQWRKGHKYLTLVYQIDQGCRRLLWIELERVEKSLRGFFEMLGEQGTAALRFICSDMWQPYLKVIADKASQAIHVLDRFHIMAKLNKAIDEVRAEEARRLKTAGYEQVFKHSRWCLLKRPENCTEKQRVKLAEILKYNLRTVRAYPELRWLNRHAWLPPAVLTGLCFLAGGWSGLVWGFVISTVLSHHATFAVNSLCHLFGRRRYATADASRNNLLVAVFTLGEGWHNNHHHYQSSANQGFFWWEIDVSYYVIKLLGWVGLVWDVRTPARKQMLSSSVAPTLKSRRIQASTPLALASQPSSGEVAAERLPASLDIGSPQPLRALASQ